MIDNFWEIYPHGLKLRLKRDKIIVKENNLKILISRKGSYCSI